MHIRLTQPTRLTAFVGLVVGLAGCYENDLARRVDPLSSGTANFSRYVAVGNSLTAGFMDGGLYRDGQLNSYPNILAGQFRLVGGGDFVQPLFPVEQANGTGYIKLTSLPTAASGGLPVVAQVAPQAVRSVVNGRPLLTKFTSYPNNNLGVPGIRMSDINIPGYGTTQGNPYFERLLPDNSTQTYLQYVSAQASGASFFSSFMGNNDALGYATTGGVTPFTPTALFTANNNALLDLLSSGGRKGVVIGIPKITVTPFFQVITVAQILTRVNAALQAATPGAPAVSALVIRSTLAPQGIRATKAGDLLLLSQQADYATIGRTDVGTKVGPYGLSLTNPIADASVLDAEEAAALSAKIDEYNGVLKAAADARGLAWVDLSGLITQLSSDTYAYNGTSFGLGYIVGGVIGLDGIHFTPAGHALVANEILKAIAAKYNTQIPEIDASRYRKVLVQP